MFPKLAGMTGTALLKLPNLKALFVTGNCYPYQQTLLGQIWLLHIYKTKAAKFDAIVKEIEPNTTKQPVLVKIHCDWNF